MKVEKALHFLPALEAMAPVRALLLRSGMAEHGAAAIPGRNVTIGRRDVTPAEMRAAMAQDFQRIAEHFSNLYESYFRALEALDGGNPDEAVTQLLGAGHREEDMDRVSQAHAWYTAALLVADGLADRRPEIQALLAIGSLSLHLSYFDDATRRYRRALVLAESEFDQPSAIDACSGLGTLLVKQGVWAGADAWYSRAMRLATAAEDDTRLGRIHYGLGELARRRGDRGAAGDALRRAREKFEALGDALWMTRALTREGMLEADLKLSVRAASRYREALAWARKSSAHAGLEVFIRICLAKLHLADARFLEAEQEIRRSEKLATSAGLIRRLVQLYSLLGTLRGRQGDDTGFVFFEQALQLARMLERRPIVEAQVYHEYGSFKLLMQQPDEAHSYLERARELFESIGASADLEHVLEDLRRSSG